MGDQYMNLKDLMNTQQLSAYTGMSTSFFEKGRIYGYGPAFIRIGGRCFYRRSDVDAWLQSHRHDPEGR